MNDIYSLLDTKEGLALATQAWEEGAAAMNRAWWSQEAGDGWHKPRSPYSSPLIQLVRWMDAHDRTELAK